MPASRMARLASVGLVTITTTTLAWLAAASGAGAQANEPPNAVTDHVTTVEGTSATVFVLANDVDPEGDAMLVVSVGQPSSGTAAVNARGTPVYMPAPGFAGIDSFTYTVADAAGNQAAGTVNVEVLPAFERECQFARGTTTCVERARSIEAGEHEEVSGCLAGPDGVPGRRTAVFADRFLVTRETTTLSHGRRGPVYDETSTTSRELLESRLLMTRCDPL